MRRFSATALGNAVAWGGFVVLLCVAVWVAQALGFAGLFLLGGVTWLVCSRAAMDSETPTWGVEVMRARMTRARSVEERAAVEHERQAFASPLRFYGRCGMALAGAGAVGFAWQMWGG